ncbi:MAG: DUF3034 family protein [Usitatibacteraceae bacterium]
MATYPSVHLLLQRALAGFALAALPCCVVAGDRLAVTGGVTQVEGSAGGGLVPWALVTGYGTRDQSQLTAFTTNVTTDGFRLGSSGAAVGVKDRVEVSFANQTFALGDTVPGVTIHQDVVGIKLKLSGDAVFDQDSAWPQLAVGLQRKRNRSFQFIPRLLGARHGVGTDLYLSGTKLFLAGFGGRNLLLNATVRATKANQFGILGFGGDRNDRYRLQAEVAAAVMVNDALAIGMEYRQKPDNLSVFREDDGWDLFLSWFPEKYLSLTAAYVDLGNIANKPKQRGFYFSAQGAF